MTPSEILFGFTGRLARLPYFGYSLLSVLLLGLAAFVAFPLFFAAPVLGVISVLALGVVGAWTGLAISAKRLHDLGMSGLHLIWIAALGTASRAMEESEPLISSLFGVAELIVWLFLLFAPGEPSDNQYGPAPV
jgi:uncharacterized membrane protein YhaH (DUF805 family)